MDGPRPDALTESILAGLARDARLVFVAGLPGTGKSLLIHRLAHLAHAGGRRVHLLQWDVARPVFEAGGAGRRYPVVDGVTHGVIRLAVGRWARAALVRWHAAHPDAADLLIGETPFIGHRLVDLARPEADDAEPLLAAPSTRFVIPVPSRALRAHMEAERERRARAPVHEREREDAPPAVLRDLWRQVARVGGAADDAPYTPEIYRRVYERLLRHRRVDVLPLDTRVPTGGLSAYDYRIPITDLVPTPADAERFIREVEASVVDPAELARRIDDWWVT